VNNAKITSTLLMKRTQLCVKAVKAFNVTAHYTLCVYLLLHHVIGIT